MKTYDMHDLTIYTIKHQEIKQELSEMISLIDDEIKARDGIK